MLIHPTKDDVGVILIDIDNKDIEQFIDDNFDKKQIIKINDFVNWDGFIIPTELEQEIVGYQKMTALQYCQDILKTVG